MIRCGVVLLAGAFAVLPMPIDLAAQQQAPSRARPRIPAAVERAIQDVFAAYAGGDDLAVERWLATSQARSSVAYLELVLGRDTGPSIRTKPAFLLEVAAAMTSVPTPRDGLMYASSPRIANFLKTGLSLIVSRPTAPGLDASEDRFELLWLEAAIGVAQGLQQYWLQQDLLDIVGLRFADPRLTALVAETRIPLARAIAAGGLCCWKRVEGEVIQIGPSSDRRSVSLDQALALHVHAATIPALRTEALVRGAVLLHKMDKPADALAWFAQVPTHTDRSFGYVQHRTLGRLLDGTDRATDAASAYLTALTFEPASQLAGIGLAAALLRSGRPEEAAAAAAEARTMTAEPNTFEASFRRADRRFVPEWLAEIRRVRR